MENSKEVIETVQWSNPKKIGFRFLFIYISVFIVIVNNGAYPFWYYVMEWPNKWLQMFIPWVGKNILNLSDDITVFTNGSGDTTYDYVIQLCILTIAVFCTLIWTLLDRKWKNYSKLYYWLTTGVRYYIALMLISYGMYKVIQLQFSPADVYRLEQMYGDSSPMGLAWTFLGLSKGYNMFMGIAELAAGLLLFRRTVTVGAIITLMTTANVMAVNYFYDVPVKIVSTHLVLLTLFLLSKDIKKLIKLFFKGESISLTKIQRPDFKPSWINKVLLGFKVLILGNILYGVTDFLDMEKQFGLKAPKPNMYGLYNVTDFVINGDTITNYKDERLWRSIAVQREGSLRISKFDGKRSTYYGVEKDSLKDVLKLKSWSDEDIKFDLNYKKIDSLQFEFNTIIDSDTIYVKTKRKTVKDFLLRSREFRWISEYPFNR